MAKAQTYNDQEIVNNLLISLKQMKSLLNTFTQESSTPELYSEISTMYDTVSTLQRDVYDFMVEESWMQVESQTQTKIDKSYKQLSKKLQSLN